MDLIMENLGLISQSPWAWGGFALIGVVTLPISTFLLDHITQITSDLIVKVNNLVIRKIPIVILRKWLENRQIEMLERSIATYRETIQKLKP